MIWGQAVAHSVMTFDASDFNLNMHQNYRKGLLKHSCWVPPLPLPQILMQWVWGGARECVFLASPQGMLMLLVWGPLEVENHCP